MPRPLIGINEKAATQIHINSSTVSKTELSPLQLDRRLRQNRSPEYVAAMTKLDSGGYASNNEALEKLIELIRQELPEVSIEHLPSGIVAKCYLEPPHEVHCLDRDGSIIKHYKTFEPLPPLLEKARSLAIHGGYVFIEVYYDCLRAVKSDGTISVVKEHSCSKQK